jgi:hypothetical protein
MCVYICKMQIETVLFMLQQSLQNNMHFAVPPTRILRETGHFSLLSSSRTGPTALPRAPVLALLPLAAALCLPAPRRRREPPRPDPAGGLPPHPFLQWIRRGKRQIGAALTSTARRAGAPAAASGGYAVEERWRAGQWPTRVVAEADSSSSSSSTLVPPLPRRAEAEQRPRSEGAEELHGVA